MSFKKNLQKKYAVDLNLEEDGKWIKFDGFELKIRRLNSKASDKARSEAVKPYQDNIQNNTLTDEAAEEILNKQICYGIIADWRGDDIVDDDGKPVPFSGDAALEVFGSQEMKDLKSTILAYSNDAAIYRKKVEDEAVGN